MFGRKLSTERPASNVAKPQDERFRVEGATYCSDCRWFVLDEAHLEFSQCANPKVDTRALVSPGVAGAFCSNARHFEAMCGEKARHFESKPDVPCESA